MEREGLENALQTRQLNGQINKQHKLKSYLHASEWDTR